MRNKLILFLMLALFGSASFLRADEVTIGDPTATTTNSYLPTYSLYEYSFTQQIYTADEIGMGGTISDVTLWLKNTSSYARNLNVYMKETSEVTFADGTSWISMTDADLVASGTLANGITDPVEMTFTLNAPFNYSGNGNLVICFQDVTGSWSSGAASVVMTGNGYQAIYAYRDGTAYDPTTPGVSGTRTENKSVVRLNITSGGGGGGTVSGELTVHDGEQTNSYVPIYGFYADAYLKCEMVYPAAELAQMDGASINSIKFYSSTPASEAWTSTWQVFVAEVADATISDFYGPGTVVYEGTLDGTLEEMEIVFDAPYAYNGGNLLIGVYNTTTGNYKSITWAGEAVDGASVQGYNYSSLSGVTASQRNFLPKTTFAYVSGSTPEPPVPTDPVAITPNPFDMGYRPINGWMEPMVMRIHNNLETSVTMTGNMSNTAGVNAFVMSEEIDEVVLESGEDFTAEIDINRNAAAGDYAEQFTLFYIENDRDITLVPVTATFYTAGNADIVEKAVAVNGLSFNDTPANLHANYNLYGMTEMKTDAVYLIDIEDDYHFHATGGDDFIAVYKKADVDANHLTAAVEPVLLGVSGIIDDEILLAGEYYLVIASENISNVVVNFTEIEPATELTYTAPANGATEVSAPVSLCWTGGANATEYKVLFGTSPTNMTVVLDWTLIDENYGTYTVNSVLSNTQYFWKVMVRNSHGTVEGPRWGFTTTLTTPNTVTATPNQIFTDGSTLIKWKHNAGTMGDLDETQIGSGTSTNSYLPTYNLYNYSLSEQIYTAEELGGEAGYINSISFHPVGDITRNLKVYIANTDKESFTGSSDWVAMTEDDLVYEGNVSMVANTWVTIEFDEPFEYEGENIILAVTDHTGTWTSSISYSVFDATAQAINIYQDAAAYSATAPSGSGTVRDFKNQIIINKADRAIDNTRDFLHYNVYVDGVQANDEPIYEKQYILSNLEYNMEGHVVAVTAVYDEGESPITTAAAQVLVYVSGYGTFTGTVTELISGVAMADVNVKFVGKDEFDNNVVFEGVTDINGVYTINNVKAGNYIGTASFEGMESSVSDPVTLVYEGTEIVDFQIHEVYKPVRSVVAEEMDSELARVRWSLDVDIPVPTPGGNTPGGGSASSFTEGFENGMPADWTVIDGNNDGWTWCLTSAIPTTWTYYASMSLDWYRTGTNAICSGSYINGVGALTPNEYLVMGQQNLVNGSTLSFWAAAADATYPADHFGVFVSDDATDWTSVQEWTLTGKGTRNGGRESRDGNGAKLGTWYNYSVDLSAYAGNKYIAIRHFNCNDQYIMCVDDIELSTAKGTRDVFTYDVYRAAILTEEGEPLNVADIEDPTPYYIGTVVRDEFGIDTLYADFDWANQIPGLYQYGVAANYPDPNRGNRDEVVIGDPTSTTVNNYLPTYSLYDYSLTQQIYTADEIGMAGTINTLTMWLKNSSSYARNINVYMKEADVVTFADANAWVSMEDSDMVASFTLANGISSPVETAIALNTPFNYSGAGNLVICFQDVTGSWSSGAGSVVMTGNGNQAIYAYRDGTLYNPTTPGVTGYLTTNKSVIMLDITPGGGGGNDDPHTSVTWSNVLPKDIETTVVLNAQVPDASAEGVTVRFDNTFENTTFTVTLDETGTDTIVDFRKGEYTVTFNLDGYTSNINSAPYSIWNDTEITAVFEEIFKPVTSINASRTGYVTWDAIIPVDSRVAEYYIVRLDGAEYAETVYNFLQIDEDDLTVGQTYEVGVAVMYTSGISQTVYTTFTYADCESAAHQVEDLEATNEPGNTNVTLAWNGATPTPTPPTPPTPPTGDVTIVLQADDVWGDGSGYQMLLDDTHSLYGSVIPETGALSMNCSGNESIYNQFSHKIPTNADGNCSTQNMVNNNSVSITIPAGTYDWCITNPTPGDRIWIASAGGSIGGRYDDYTFEGGHTYTFHVYFGGSNDATDLTITGGKALYQPKMAVVNNDVKVSDVVVERTLGTAGQGFGAVASPTDDGNWYYYDNGTNYDAIGLTAGGGFYWGIMFPAGSYEGNRLTKISYFDYAAHTGTVTIYQGGTSAPQTQLHSQAYSVSGTEQYIEIAMEQAVEVDNTQPLWVVMHNNNGQYVASIDAGPGVNYGSCISTDGSTWYTTISSASGGQLDGNWNLRAYVESGSGPAPSALVPNKYNIFFDGELVGATASNTFTYDAADFAEHEYVVIWVDSDYLESCIVDGENKIDYAAAPLGVAENMINTTIYPNPTDGEIRINANNMVRISIVNTLGQVVYDKAVNGNEAIINMAQFGNGVYMVNIATENGTSVKRVVVSK